MPLEKRDKPESKEDKKDITTNNRSLSQAGSDSEMNKTWMKKMPKNSQIRWKLKLTERSNLTIHWLSLMTMTIMFQTTNNNLKTTKTKKLILMKSLMANFLMMMHT